MALSLVAAMSMGLLAGCDAQQKEQVHLTVKTPALSSVSVCDPEIDSADEFLVKMARAFAAQYRDADVTIDVVTFSQTGEDGAVTDCFDTENAVDVLYEGYFNMATYIHTGRVVPLDDIITDEIRTDISESTWAISQIDGKTYRTLCPITRPCFARQGWTHSSAARTRFRRGRWRNGRRF